MTTLFYKAVILQGEIWCWSLLGLKGLKYQLNDTDLPLIENYGTVTNFQDLVTNSNLLGTLVLVLWHNHFYKKTESLDNAILELWLV